MSRILEDRCVIHLLKGGQGDDGALHNNTQCVTVSIYYDCPQQYSFAHMVVIDRKNYNRQQNLVTIFEQIKKYKLYIIHVSLRQYLPFQD